jgi:ribokinase
VAIAEGADPLSAAHFAAAAGALATTRAGAVPSLPRRAEIETLLASA